VPYQLYLDTCTGSDERFAMTCMADLSGITFDEELYQSWSRRKAVSYASFGGGRRPRRCRAPSSWSSPLPIGLATGSRMADVKAALNHLVGGRMAGSLPTHRDR
jgi:hypothetical protein